MTLETDVDLMAIDDVNNALAHYGVLGMKWGKRKRKEPKKPKVVSAEKQARREKKAKTFDAQAANSNARLAQLRRNRKTANGYQRMLIDNEAKDVQKVRTRALDDAKRVREGRLTSGQKNLIVGASVVATIIAAKATHDGIQSGEFSRLISKGKNLMDGKQAVDFAKNVEFARKDFDADDILNAVVKGNAPVNPGFGDIGTTMNCRRATFAYEMRRRGFAVQATRTTNAYGQNSGGLVNAIYKDENVPTGMWGMMTRGIRDTYRETNGGGTSRLLETAKVLPAGARSKINDFVSDTMKPGGERILEALSKQPDGSRGELGVMWKAGGGHSMAYEIIKGKAVIFDNQTGEKIADSVAAAKHGLDEISDAGFTRLDNVDLNMDYLMRWVKNVGK